MTRALLDRLALPGAMAALLLLALAYWWLDNLPHEIFGTVTFALLIRHIISNRAWFRNLTRGRYDARRASVLVLHLVLIVNMAVLLTTSLVKGDLRRSAPAGCPVSSGDSLVFGLLGRGDRGYPPWYALESGDGAREHLATAGAPVVAHPGLTLWRGCLCRIWRLEFCRAGRVDEAHLYLQPRILGLHQFCLSVLRPLGGCPRTLRRDHALRHDGTSIPPASP